MYSKPSQTFNVKLCAKMTNKSWNLLRIFATRPILYVGLRSEYISLKE